jgi:HupE / UreJ protein
MSRAWALALLCMLAAGQPALAESRSVVYSIWDVLGSTVHLRVMMRTGEARRLVGPGLPAPTIEVVKDYVAAHVAVTASGTACPPVDQGEEAGLINTLSLSPGLYRFEVIFQCAKPDNILLQNTVLHDLVPDHVDFARVQVNGGGFVLRLFREGYESISASSAGAVFGDSGILQYVSMGLGHVLRNLDRLCFVLGLMLMVRMRRDYGLILAGLSLGYACSIAVSLSGIVEPRMDLVDALIGLMSALVAAQIVASISGRPEIVAIVVGGSLLIVAAALPTLEMSSRVLLSGTGIFAGCYLLICDRLVDRVLFWLLPTALFALLDGSDLPADVAILDVPGRQLAPMLVGFDVGSLLADAIVMAAALAAVLLLRRVHFVMPRSAAVDVGAATLAGVGVLWFVSRLYI